jgi:hypothetical protein
MALARPLIQSLLLAAILPALTPIARADENLFGYVTGADTLPQGAGEIYQWVTYRKDKGVGEYSAYDLKTELEYGFTDRLTGSLYLNASKHNIQGAAPLADTNDDGVGDTPEYPDLSTGIRFQGVQASVKYNILSPYKDGWGLSVYVEPGYSTIFKISGQKQQEYSLETKLILQKNFLDDQLVWATNLSPEFERRKFDGESEWEKEMSLELSSGLSYRFAPKWYAALEARYHSEYPDWPDHATREHWAVFLGPTLHFGDQKWWFTVTWLPQLRGGPTDPTRSDTLHLEEHEKNEYRLKVGYNF